MTDQCLILDVFEFHVVLFRRLVKVNGKQTSPNICSVLFVDTDHEAIDFFLCVVLIAGD